MNLQRLKTILFIFFAVVISIFLFSYFLSSSAAPMWLQFFPREIIAVCRDSETQWMVVLCLVIYFTLFLILERRTVSEDRNRNIWLVVMMVLALGYYAFGYARNSYDVQMLVFLVGLVSGKAAVALLQRGNGMCNFLIYLIFLLAFSSWWHLDMSNNYYHGPRWMGLWNNPNDFGMLMSVGVLLSVGLFADRRWKLEDGEKQKRKLFQIRNLILVVAVFMMGTGLIFSYSRGAWLGTTVALAYLAWCYGKLKWKYVVIGLGLLALGVGLFWSRTPDSSPWYLKRADLGRPSAQHRIAAWRAGLEIMRDHPFGVGWNKTIETYEKNYSPPKDGASAITTNDYLMLGTQLGIPALICFLVYVALQLGVGKWLADRRWKMENRRKAEGKIKNEEVELRTLNSELRIQIACRAVVIAMLVEFWFDGGLFKLATASVFWILLELGAERNEGVKQAATATEGKVEEVE